MSPALLAEALEDARARGAGCPRAVVVVHLYGQCADLEPILAACARHDVPVLEDAAEALGASYRGRPAGTLGDVGAFSFNGNKIITCSGGGMLVARGDRVAKARHWATQAREAARRVPPRRARLQLPALERARRDRARAARGARGAGAPAARGASSATARRSRTCPGSTPMPEAAVRPAHALALLLPRGRGRVRRDARRPPRARSPPPTSRRGRSGSRCTCSRCTRGASAYGGRGRRGRCSRAGVCLPSSSSLAREDQDRVVGVIRGVARGARTVRDRAGTMGERTPPAPPQA